MMPIATTIVIDPEELKGFSLKFVDMFETCPQTWDDYGDNADTIEVQYFYRGFGADTRMIQFELAENDRAIYRFAVPCDFLRTMFSRSGCLYDESLSAYLTNLLNANNPFMHFDLFKRISITTLTGLVGGFLRYISTHEEEVRRNAVYLDDYRLYIVPKK
jgi:hypothetical protein